MNEYEDQKMQEQLRGAYEAVSPDAQAKARMLAAIMQAAEEDEYQEEQGPRKVQAVEGKLTAAVRAAGEDGSQRAQGSRMLQAVEGKLTAAVRAAGEDGSQRAQGSRKLQAVEGKKRASGLSRAVPGFAAAACLLLVVGVGVSVSPLMEAGNKSDSSVMSMSYEESFDAEGPGRSLLDAAAVSSDEASPTLEYQGKVYRFDGALIGEGDLGESLGTAALHEDSSIVECFAIAGEDPSDAVAVASSDSPGEYRVFRSEE